jgi:hypothetical protein
VGARIARTDAAFWLRAGQLALLALTLVLLALFARRVVDEIASSHGLLQADGVSPLGGDFINLLTAGRLAEADEAATIYLPDAFMAAQKAIIPAYIGLRLWAYPPHSLFVAVPFGFTGFWLGFVLWSAVGLLVLGWGARRAGFSWLETAIIVLSPAALRSIYYGQTGNLAGGLLLLALASRRPADGVSIVSAALLTIKPQAGLLLPVFWLVRRQFRLIVWTAAAVAALLLASAWAFGPDAWRHYLAETLPRLNALERHGTGPFLAMIPSTFVAVRLLTGNALLAGILHWVVAGVAGAICLWRLMRTGDRDRQLAIVLAGTAVITPYLHIYDLAPLVAAGLLGLRFHAGHSRSALIVAAIALLGAWGLPTLTPFFNVLGLPLSPLLLLFLLAVVAWPRTTTAAGPSPATLVSPSRTRRPANTEVSP